MDLRVRMLNQASSRVVQDAPVGVQWQGTWGWASSHASTSGVAGADKWSRMMCNSMFG